MTDKRPWKRWYGLARWQRLREAQLTREPLCAMCLEQDMVKQATVCDHVTPHQGDEELFWSGPFQSLCAPCHDIHKQRQEVAAGFHGAYQYRPEWLEPSKIPLVIVCGPPAGGKTTYVREHSKPSDLTIDLDVIASGLSGQTVHGWDRAKWLSPAMRHRNKLLGRLSGDPAWHRAWLILSEADPDKRQWWVDKMQPERVVVIETPAAICMDRARADEGRARDATFEAIGKWWSMYGRRDGDEVIKS